MLKQLIFCQLIVVQLTKFGRDLYLSPQKRVQKNKYTFLTTILVLHEQHKFNILIRGLFRPNFVVFLNWLYEKKMLNNWHQK